MKVIYNDGRIQTVFNGKVYLSRDLFYSKQYLGSGETATEAEKNVKKTIKDHKLKQIEIN